VNQETLAFDVIEKVGPGGHYVMEDHTVEHMMDEFFYPALSVRSNFDIWVEKGRPDMLSRAREIVQRILDEGKEGLLGHDLIAEIKEAFPGLCGLQTSPGVSSAGKQIPQFAFDLFTVQSAYETARAQNLPGRRGCRRPGKE
jgi:hypothetical protein